MNTNEIISDWLKSNKMVKICGMDFVPEAHPLMPTMPKCITKGQASAYFLKQLPHNNIWLLKIFSPGKLPDSNYLQNIDSFLPGKSEFYSCKQRRLLQSEHINVFHSDYKKSNVQQALEGGILMPCVPGQPWLSTSEDLRDGSINLSIEQRIKTCIDLFSCIEMLESAKCSHRDLSAGNVFVDIDKGVNIIDWDCVYHAGLSFQHNTTVGTMGYIAPFIKATTNNPNAEDTWCERSDRFSAAVLAVEILTTDTNTRPIQEDGSMFSQAEIDNNPNDIITSTTIPLLAISPSLPGLFEKCIKAHSFEDCPAPGEWLRALKNTLRNILNPEQRYTYVYCDKCNYNFRVSQDLCDQLKQNNKDVLCRDCLSKRAEENAQKRKEKKYNFPEVVCEHCNEQFKIKREKLDDLRKKGNPVLCYSCFGKQLELWKRQNNDRFTEMMCPVCYIRFKIDKRHYEGLVASGKTVFCKTCLGRKLNKAV